MDSADAVEVSGLGLASVTRKSARHTNRQIAQALFVSEKTASVHVTNLLHKLRVTSRFAAVARRARLNLTSTLWIENTQRPEGRLQ